MRFPLRPCSSAYSKTYNPYDMSSRRRKKRSRFRKYLGKTLKWLALPATLCLVGIFYCNHIIDKAAKGKTYSDISVIPHRTTALLLGTNPKSRSGNPNSFYVHRIDAAVALYKAGKYDRLIVSGAADKEGYNEPLAMRADLIERGLPDSVMVLDEEGDRTIYSMKRAKETFGADSCLIISQEFHNKRAIFQAQHLGLDAIGFNAADSPYLYWRVKIHLREYLARVKAVIEVESE